MPHVIVVGICLMIIAFIQTAALLSNTVTIIAQMPGIRIILDDITLRFTATDSIQILFS